MAPEVQTHLSQTALSDWLPHSSGPPNAGPRAAALMASKPPADRGSYRGDAKVAALTHTGMAARLWGLPGNPLLTLVRAEAMSVSPAPGSVPEPSRLNN